MPLPVIFYSELSDLANYMRRHYRDRNFHVVGIFPTDKIPPGSMASKIFSQVTTLPKLRKKVQALYGKQDFIPFDWDFLLSSILWEKIQAIDKKSPSFHDFLLFYRIYQQLIQLSPDATLWEDVAEKEKNWGKYFSPFHRARKSYLENKFPQLISEYDFFSSSAGINAVEQFSRYSALQKKIFCVWGIDYFSSYDLKFIEQLALHTKLYLTCGQGVTSKFDHHHFTHQNAIQSIHLPKSKHTKKIVYYHLSNTAIDTGVYFFPKYEIDFNEVSKIFENLEDVNLLQSFHPGPSGQYLLKELIRKGFNFPPILPGKYQNHFVLQFYRELLLVFRDELSDSPLSSFCGQVFLHLFSNKQKKILPKMQLNKNALTTLWSILDLFNDHQANHLTAVISHNYFTKGTSQVATEILTALGCYPSIHNQKVQLMNFIDESFNRLDLSSNNRNLLLIDETKVADVSPVCPDNWELTPAATKYFIKRPKQKLPYHSQYDSSEQDLKLSASRIQNYIDCPHRYYLKYIKKLFQPKESSSIHSGIEKGTLLHHLLASYFQKHPSLITPILEDLIEGIRPKHYSELSWRLEKDYYLHCLVPVLNWLYELKGSIPNARFHFEEKIQRQTLDYTFWGYADLVIFVPTPDSGQMQIMLIDFKKGKGSIPSQKEMRDLCAIQLTSYHVTLQVMYPESEVSCMGYICFEDFSSSLFLENENSIFHQSKKKAPDFFMSDLFQRYLDREQSAVKKMLSKDFHPNPRNNTICNFCEAKLQCPNPFSGSDSSDFEVQVEA